MRRPILSSETSENVRRLKFRAAFVFGVAMDFRGCVLLSRVPGQWTLSAYDLYRLSHESQSAYDAAKEAAEDIARRRADLVSRMRSRRPKRPG